MMDPDSTRLESTRQKVRFGDGAVSEVAATLDRWGASRILVVADRTAYSASGAEARVAEAWRSRRVETFDDFRINPKLEDVERGVEAFRDLRPDAIVAIGGGSALDMAKLIGAFGAGIESPRNYADGAAPLVAGPPTIAVPTTAGTGSEATHFAVVYVDGRKRSIAGEALRPACAILDPTLTHSLPPGTTAASGLDALCQAIESTWSVGATDVSLADATQAAGLALANLRNVVRNPDPSSRREMMRAAYLAGRAIDVTKTTAPHATSYALTTRYGTPHGVAVALMLGPFLRHNDAVGEADCCDPRGADHVRRRIASIVEALGAASIGEACERWEQLLIDLDAPTRLRAIGADESDLDELAGAVDVERLSNNPRRIDRDELVALLKSIY